MQADHCRGRVATSKYVFRNPKLADPVNVPGRGEIVLAKRTAVIDDPEILGKADFGSADGRYCSHV